MNRNSVSFSGQGQSDPQAAAMKQEFENARDGFLPDLQKSGDVENPETPSLELKPADLDPDLQALNALENEKLDFLEQDEVAFNKDQDFDFGR